jgi:hypothetical protein
MSLIFNLYNIITTLSIGKLKKYNFNSIKFDDQKDLLVHQMILYLI